MTANIRSASSTPRAEDLVAQVAGELRDVDQALRNHPYTEAFRSGHARVAALEPFLAHQYHIIGAFADAGPRLLQRVDPDLAGDFVRGFLQGAEISRARIPVMAAEVGMNKAALQAFALTPAGFAFGPYFNHLFSQGTLAEVFCSLLVNMPAWSHNCLEIGRALRELYGWSPLATTFVDGYGLVPNLEAELLPIIQAGLDQGEDPKAIARTAKLTQGYEVMFWDAMAAEAAQHIAENRFARRLSA